MSLLLDALKKAAEQKAKKSKQEAAPAPSGDETVINAAPEDLSELDADAGAQVQPRDVQDETELDPAELTARYERTHVEREAADETGIDAPEQTDTRIPPSDQLDSGEDETIIFADEDVSEFLGEPQFINRDPRPADDETDLSQLVSTEDPTGVEQASPSAPADDTDLSQLAHSEEATEYRHPPVDEDQTDISVPPHLAEGIGHGRADAGVVTEDTDLSRIQEPEDTDLGQAEQPGEDTDLSRLRGAAGEDTDISREVEPPASDTPVETDPEPSEPQDLSLLLADSDQTSQTTRTSATDPRAAGGMPAAGDDELALVDTTQHRPPPEPVEATETAASATTPTGVRLDTLTTEGTTTRTESTATRTYAPDNYDRTLMKLPSDDASKLFAGMKSDGDVVMTPDYAKKVFRSKSSAQRLQHIKIYSGIFLLLLTAVGFYAVFEFASQTDAIETSLRPLKRDPMPGVIPSRTAEDAPLFTEGGEVSQQTLEIIESADEGAGAAVADQGVIAGGDDAGAVADAGQDTGSTETVAASSGAETAMAEPTASGDDGAATTTVTDAAAEGAVSDSGVIASLDSETTTAATNQSAGNSNLEIITGNRIDENQLRLRDAYAAYQAGNDKQALELYNAVLRESPGNRNALLGRAAIYVQNGNAAAAVDDYQSLLLANPKDSLAMSSLIAVANLSPQESETQLKLMIREEPESPHLNFALGNAYGAQNRWLEAQGFYFVALQNNPNDPNYAYNLAVSLEHIEQPRAALTYYRRALANIGNGLATFNKDVVDQRLEVLGK